MDPHLILILIALLYLLIMGGLSVMRREGLSLQFAIEGIIVAGLLIALSVITGRTMNPVIFLIPVYLITMRARLLIDLGNLLAQRGYHAHAARVYNLAHRLKPNPYDRQMVTLNQAVHQLKQDQIDQAVTMLENLLTDTAPQLGPKHEAAARYNLAVGYQRQGNEARAIAEFNKVIDVMPASLYAKGAQIALDKGKRSKAPPEDDPKD